MTRLLAAVGLLALGLAAGWGDQAQAASGHRLGPGAERTVARCVDLARPQLTEDARIDGIHVERDHVRIELLISGRRSTLRLLAPQVPRADLRRTAAATIESGPEVASSALDALAERLDACGPKIPFVAEVDTIDHQAAARESADLLRRVETRLGLFEDEAGGPWRFSGDLSLAHQAILNHRPEEALRLLRPRLQTPNPPQGAISLWLAAKGGTEVCDRGERCPVGEVITDLLDGHLHGEWTARWAQEPRLLLLASERAAKLGDRRRASAFLMAALASELGDQAAVDRAVTWGWGPGSRTEGLPGVERSNSPEQTGSTSSLLLLAAALLFCLAWWGVRARRASLGLVGAGIAAGLLVAQVLSVPGQETLSPGWEPPSEAQMRWGRGAGCQLGWPTVIDGALYGPMRCGEATMGVMALLEEDGLGISVMPQVGMTTLDPETERWKRSVEDSDEGALWSALERDASVEPGLGEVRGRLARLELHQLRAIQATGPVAALAALCLLGLLFMALRTLWECAGGNRGARWSLLTALLLALGTHMAAPSAMVMVYGGYGQVSELVAWQPLRYGAGANWLYGPWLELFGYDHAVVQGANRVYGLLTLVFLTAWSERMVAATSGYVALALALSPILWRDHASESILVGGMLMLSAGLWGLARTEAGRTDSALLALPCLALAAMTRPEFALFSVPLVVLTGLQIKDRVGLIRDDWRGLALGVAATLLLAPATLAYLEASTRWMVETGALPGLESLSSRLLGDAVNPLRAFSDLGQWTPWATLPLALLASSWPGSRGLGFGTLIVALAWMAFTRVDLPAVSIPRVHAPVCALLVVAAGAGLRGLVVRLGETSWAPRARRGSALLVALWWCVEVPPIASALYEPTNADAEELLIRDAEDAITGEQVCLATLDSRDPPARGKTPRVWPSYLFTGRGEPVRILGLGEVESAATVCPGGTYALLGVRCYMALREAPSDATAPPGSPLLRSCAEFKERWPLETVIERRVKNHGDLAYPMYPKGAHLTVGLYRVLRRGTAGARDTGDRRGPPR